MQPPPADRLTAIGRDSKDGWAPPAGDGPGRKGLRQTNLYPAIRPTPNRRRVLRTASKGLEELSAPANSILAARTRRSRRGDNRLRRAPRDDAPCRDAPRELRRPRSTPQRPAGPARPARHSDQASRGPGAAGTRRLGPTPRGGVDSFGERDPVATAHRLGAGFVPPHPYAVDPPPEVRGVFPLMQGPKRARPRVRAGP